MVLLFCVNDCLIFSPSKDNIVYFYDYLYSYFNIDTFGEINKYLGIRLDLHPCGSIHLRQPHITQMIINLIPGIENSGSNPNPFSKPPLASNKGDQTRKLL